MPPQPKQAETGDSRLPSSVERPADARPGPYPDGEADVDLDRAFRCGFPEVIYGEGKPPDLVVRILRQQQDHGQRGMVTRVSAEQAEAVLGEFPQTIYNPIARTLRVPLPTTSGQEDPGPRVGSDDVFRCENDNSGPDQLGNLSGTSSDDAIFVAVVTAGSSDRPVAEEAVETLLWMQVPCEFIQDCGVAGPHRLLRHVPRLQQAAVIVCVAGMEAALPSVLGGHVSCPVIGVPTSVGYGASQNGMTAMLSMLTCCASNVVTVNIDAGFRGGYVAGMIATRLRQQRTAREHRHG